MDFYSEYKTALEEKAMLFGSNGTDFDKVDAAVDALIVTTPQSSGWFVCFHHEAGEIIISSRSTYQKITYGTADSLARVIQDLTGVKVRVVGESGNFVLKY